MILVALFSKHTVWFVSEQPLEIKELVFFEYLTIQNSFLKGSFQILTNAFFPVQFKCK